MPARSLLIATMLPISIANVLHAESPSPRDVQVVTAPAAHAVDHSRFQVVLDKYLKDGLIDYLSLRDNDLPLLRGYLDAMAAVDHTTLPRNEQLALYCNLYNATMMHAIAMRYRVGFRGNEAGAYIFREPMVRLSTGIVTLNHLEHEMIRKGFNDPRIHGALVCAGLGCPKLVPGVFTGENLDAQLTAAMTGWITDPSRNQLDITTKTFHVSRLFKHYADDFGGLDKVPAYLDRYDDRDLSSYRIEYQTSYDWAPNSAVPPGRWVWVSAVTASFFDAPGGSEISKLGMGAIARTISQQVGSTGTYLQIRQPGTDKDVWIHQADTLPYPPESSQSNAGR